MPLRLATLPYGLTMIRVHGVRSPPLGIRLVPTEHLRFFASAHRYFFHVVPTEHLPLFCLSPPCIFSCGTDGARVLLRLNPSKTCAFSPQPTSIYSRHTDAIPELLRLSPPPFLGVVPTGNTCTLSPQSTPIFFVWYRRNTFAFSRPTPPATAAAAAAAAALVGSRRILTRNKSRW